MLADKSASGSGIKNGNMSNKELTEELHKLFENLEKVDSSFLNLNLKDVIFFIIFKFNSKFYTFRLSTDTFQILMSCAAFIVSACLY